METPLRDAVDGDAVGILAIFLLGRLHIDDLALADEMDFVVGVRERYEYPVVVQHIGHALFLGYVEVSTYPRSVYENDFNFSLVFSLPNARISHRGTPRSVEGASLADGFTPDVKRPMPATAIHARRSLADMQLPRHAYLQPIYVNTRLIRDSPDGFPRC